ncbi:Maltose O-acetyltransferase [Phytophthora megakarya]|uniref:Maltose O-acetyltransferase n=1 Tax=Phytophthora megakarya TaxID=4795 RepID=A0A225WP65_9STRA|nr:Maltose O-acetyltransferase [Phytophthora megakarya]
MDTEKAKMIRGEMHNLMDETLVGDRLAARVLTRKYNDLIPGEYSVADALLTRLLGSKGRDCFIETPFHCDYGYNINVGDGVYMNVGCVLLDVCPITIGNRVLLAPNVQLYTASHPLDAKKRAAKMEIGKPITIEDDAWIGGNVIIVPGVRIGYGAVIGAGSVVTKDVPPMCVYAGNPAKFIKKIGSEATEETS